MFFTPGSSPVENDQLGDSLSTLVNEDDPQDIFSRESQFIRRNSNSGNTSSIHGRTSSLVRTKTPSGLKDDTAPFSPTHVRLISLY